MENLILFLKKNKIKYFKNKDIKVYTTIKIGGKVSLIIIINTYSKLTELILKVKKRQYPFVLLGGGSNVVFPDNNSKLVVIINRTSNIIKLTENLIKINSGVTISNLMKWCIGNKIGDLEFLAGIPGTIGGASAVNAGAFGKSVSDNLEKAEILTEKGEIKIVDKKYFRFEYRNSVFKYGKEVILNVFLKYINQNENKIKEKITSHIRHRKQSHPSYKCFTAGCFFKNPVKNNKRISAGTIIEDSRLKGFYDNNLLMSERHSNFLINKGNASFKDLINFENKITQEILKSEGIKLEREVIYITSDGEKC